MLASVGNFRSCLEALPTLARGVLVGPSILYTCLCYHLSSSSSSAGRIGAPRTGARRQAAISGDDLVGVVRRSPMFSQGGLETPLASSFECFYRVWLLLYSCLSLICFVRGFPHHIVSVWPCGFIYKAGRKPVSWNNLVAHFINYLLRINVQINLP